MWGVTLTVRAALGNPSTTHSVLLVFLGWAIAWVSTTIARFVIRRPNAGSRQVPISERPDAYGVSLQSKQTRGSVLAAFIGVTPPKSGGLGRGCELVSEGRLQP